MLRLKSIAGLFLVLFATSAHASKLLWIQASNSTPLERLQVETATEFYGIDLRAVTVGTPSEAAEVAKQLQKSDVIGVVISASVLDKVPSSLMSRGTHHQIPVLILGVSPETDIAALKHWTNNEISGSRIVSAAAGPRFSIGQVKGITKELSNVQIDVAAASFPQLDLPEGSQIQQIATVESGGRQYSTFVLSTVNGNPIFVESWCPPDPEMGREWSEEGMVAAFATVAPAMMFVSYAAGEHAWHFPVHYANFTIDDPWLRESYGYLNYARLLQEMIKHNFHSTIAFIPWNFDRSQPQVVALFKEHPNRFSIVVHGDNHDHKEFTSYSEKSLPLQIDGMKQALERMNQFSLTTGVAHDNVMVFPHSIAPMNTLHALKVYNYLATVNSSNVPMGSKEPALLPSGLRPVTTEFGNFPSVRRYSTEIPFSRAFLAINSFLGNPILFYCHHDFFRTGATAFDQIADEVNALDPSIHWANLGTIARHLYLVRQQDRGSFDVLSFSNNLTIENRSGRDAVYYVEKPESDPDLIHIVQIDEKQQPYTVNAGYLHVAVPVHAGSTANLLIQYENDLATTPVGIAKTSTRVALLRTASDFRDIELPKFRLGRMIVTLYYSPQGPQKITLAGLLLLIAISAGLGTRIHKSRRRRARAVTQAISGQHSSASTH